MQRRSLTLLLAVMAAGLGLLLVLRLGQETKSLDEGVLSGGVELEGEKPGTPSSAELAAPQADEMARAAAPQMPLQHDAKAIREWSILFTPRTGAGLPLWTWIVPAPDDPEAAQAQWLSDSGTYLVQVRARAVDLEKSRLVVATSEDAIVGLNGRVVALTPTSESWRLGEIELAAGDWDHEDYTISGLAISLARLQPLGTVTVEPPGLPSMNLVTWRGRNSAGPSRGTLNQTPSGFPLACGSFDVAKSWNATISPLEPMFRASESGYGPPGTDLVVRVHLEWLQARSSIELSLNVSTLTDVRTVFIRPSNSAPATLLTEDQLRRRVGDIGQGASTISDKLPRGAGQPAIALGTTKLNPGDYAIEAWSRPDTNGKVRLLRTIHKTAKLEPLKVMIE
ncbi:MAG: hypothetical protein ACJAZN_003204 [Planctomycetota bacterium]|jgi:hypothetical protein